MSPLFIFNHYLVWHYSIALQRILVIWKNMLWFTVHYFSIPLLLRSLFAPWKRMTESKGKGWDMEAIAGAIVINFFSRFLGALIRGILIGIGLATLAVEIGSIILVYAFWLTAPALVLILFVWGLFFVF